MKQFIAIVLILSVIMIIAIPAPVEAGGNNGLAMGGALLGGFFLGSVLNHHDRVIVGPVYPPYPPPVYYPSPVYYPPPMTYPYPVYYPPAARWIPDHYESRWQTVCEVMYQRQHCYPAQITVFIPGHWEYR